VSGERFGSARIAARSAMRRSTGQAHSVLCARIGPLEPVVERKVELVGEEVARLEVRLHVALQALDAALRLGVGRLA
jgi:hypothetical protein